MKHEPCRLLRDSNARCNFVAANAVLAVHDHPESRHPLVESHWGIFKDGADFDGELLLASLAEPKAPGANEPMLVGTATWACDFAVDPAEFNREIKHPIRVCEVNDGLLECYRLFHVNKCN